MSLLATSYEHIVLDADEVPLIAGTSMKVVELVQEQATYGWSAEELHFQHPYLSLGQIYSALAFYWDHKEALDGDIARRRERIEALRCQTGEAPLAARLRGEQ